MMVDVAFVLAPVVTVLFFLLLPPRRALVATLVVGWLVLPVASVKFAGIPDFTKLTVTNLSALMGVMVFDGRTLLRFRPRWYDLPMLVWLLCPVPSSMLNGLGLYDACSQIVKHTEMWGVGYVLGRVYFGTLEGMSELLIGVMIGGVAYILPCWWEVRMSPQLHRMVYGFFPHSFLQQIRYGGYRPVVFLGHGLVVCFWMSISTVIATVYWRLGAKRKLWGAPMSWVVGLLAFTVLLCKTLTGYIVVLMAWGMIAGMRRWAGRWILILAACGPLVYIGARGAGVWRANGLLEATEAADTERAESLETRLVNETLLSARARQRPIFGWGGWGRNRIRNKQGEDVSITDGMWIINFGEYGLVGLAAWAAVLVLPLWRTAWAVPQRSWKHPGMAPAMAGALVVLMCFINDLPNAEVDPITVPLIGGLGTLASLLPVLCGAAKRPPVPRKRQVSLRLWTLRLNRSGIMR